MNNTDYAFLFFILFVITTVLWWKGEEVIEFIKEKMNRNKPPEMMQGHTTEHPEWHNVMSTEQMERQGAPLGYDEVKKSQVLGTPQG